MKPLSHFLSFLLVATLLISAILVFPEVRAETTATVDIPLELGRNIFESNSSHKTNPTTYFIDGQSGFGGRALFRFNITSITGTIISASLIINCNYYKTQQTIEVRMLKGAFTTSTGWAHPDYETYNPPGSVNTAASLSVGLKNYDITAIVKGWQTGTYTNYGLLLRGNDNNDGDIIFGVPVLHVTYTAWPPTITSTPSGSGTVGAEYRYEPQANESVSWSLDAAPDWASLSDGVISGVPTGPGDYGFSLRAVGPGTLPRWQNWTATIEPAEPPTPVPQIGGTPATDATRRVWYQWTPSVDMQCYWTLNGTAGWLSINQYTGKVSGLPLSAGIYEIRLTALSIEHGTSSTLTYNITVADALDPPTDPDPIDPGGDDGGQIATVLSERMALTVLALVVVAMVVVVLLARRH